MTTEYAVMKGDGMTESPEISTRVVDEDGVKIIERVTAEGDVLDRFFADAAPTAPAPEIPVTQDEVSVDEILRRALKPGGALESARAEIEDEIKRERAQAVKQTAAQGKQVLGELASAASEYKCLRDQQLEAAAAFAALGTPTRQARQRYRQARGSAHALGLEVPETDILNDVFTEAQAARGEEGAVFRAHVTAVLAELRKSLS